MKNSYNINQPFQLDNCYGFNICNILNFTKKLIINTKEYNSFIEKCFFKIEKRLELKLPEIQKNYFINNDVEIEKNLKTSSTELIKNNETEYNENQSRSSNFSLTVLPKLNETQNISIINSSCNKFKDYTPNLFPKKAKSSNAVISNLKLTPQNILNMKKDLKLELNELDIFTKNTSTDLIYNYNLIFNNHNFYQELIKNKISEIKNLKNKNTISYLIKKFNSNTEKEISIRLNSIRIEFTNRTNKLIPPFSILLPFKYLPIFYFSSLETFKLVLLTIVKFNNKFDDIELDEEQTNKIINNLDEFDINKDNGFEKNLKKNKENIFIFEWLTPNYLFDVEIKLPQIQIHFIKKDLIVFKFIDKELLLYILEKDFINWDFYLSNYLISFKKFRNFINKVFSKNVLPTPTEMIINKDVELFNDEKKINKFSSTDKIFSYFYSYFDGFSIKNCVIKMHSFGLLTAYDEFSDNLQFFEFDIEIMFVINKLHKIKNFNEFLKKTLIYDNKKSVIKIDHSYFKDVDESSFKFFNENLATPKLELVFPTLYKFYIENGKLHREDNKISQDSIDILCLNELTNWGQIFHNEKISETFISCLSKKECFSSILSAQPNPKFRDPLKKSHTNVFKSPRRRLLLSKLSMCTGDNNIFNSNKLGNFSNSSTGVNSPEKLKSPSKKTAIKLMTLI